MKFLKTRKYRILSNVLKYSFVGVFALVLIASTTFTKNIVNASDVSLSVAKVTSTSAEVQLSDLTSGYNYAVVYKNNVTGDTLTKATVKQADGTATTSLTDLSPDTSYYVSVSYIDDAGDKHTDESPDTFRTLAAVATPATVNSTTTTDIDVSSLGLVLAESNMVGSSVDLTLYSLENITIPIDSINIYLSSTDGSYVNTKPIDVKSMFGGVESVTFDGLQNGLLYNAEAQIKLTSGQVITKSMEFLYGNNNTVKISSISPMSGNVGDMVTISGDNFIGVNDIKFGTISTITTTNSKNEITAKVPVGATNSQITVTTLKYGSATSSDVFIVNSSLGTPVDTTAVTTTSSSTSSDTSSSKIVWHGLVPECSRTGDKINTVTGNYSHPCDFNVLIGLINRLISFILVDLALPLFALILIYVAWLFLSAGGSSENVTKAKKIFFNVIIGYIIALAAWLIVKTILSAMGFTGDSYLS